MRKSSKLLVAAAAATLVATGGTAFTGTGISTSGTAASAQFVGGKVSQAVTGATLSEIKYSFHDTTNTQVISIQLTFDAAANGKAVSVTPSGGGSGVGSFACSNVTSTISTCTYTTGTDTNSGYLGLTSLDVTVASTVA
jgi:hypothetical protein